MAQSKAWKNWERVVALKIYGDRRGAYTGSGGQGKTDVIHPAIAAECKLLGAPTFGDLKSACHQAKENGEPGQVPIAFVGRKGGEWRDGLVVMKMDEFSRLMKRLHAALPDEEE